MTTFQKLCAYIVIWIRSLVFIFQAVTHAVCVCARAGEKYDYRFKHRRPVCAIRYSNCIFNYVYTTRNRSKCTRYLSLVSMLTMMAMMTIINETRINDHKYSIYLNRIGFILLFLSCRFVMHSHILQTSMCPLSTVSIIIHKYYMNKDHKTCIHFIFAIYNFANRLISRNC